jgi:hypothetical protein
MASVHNANRKWIMKGAAPQKEVVRWAEVRDVSKAPASDCVTVIATDKVQRRL